MDEFAVVLTMMTMIMMAMMLQGPCTRNPRRGGGQVCGGSDIDDMDNNDDDDDDDEGHDVAGTVHRKCTERWWMSLRWW